MSDQTPKRLEGVIMEGDPFSTDTAAGDVYAELRLPPKVRDMPLQRAIFGQVGYWGVRRTLRSYQRCIDAAVDLSQSLTALQRSQTLHEREKEIWQNIDTVRAGARVGLQAELAEQKARLARAQRDEMEEKARLQDAERKRRVAEQRLDQYDEFERPVVENEARTRVLQSERKLAELQPDESGSIGMKWAKMREKAREHADIEKEIDGIIRQHGGEENVPPSLMQAIELMREEMSADLGGTW